MKQVKSFDFGTKCVYYNYNDEVLVYDPLTKEWNSTVDSVIRMEFRQEEADTKMNVHIYYMIKQGLRSITIQTADTDVSVLINYVMPEFQYYKPEIFIDFNSGKARKKYNIVVIAKSLGFSKCTALRY